MDEETLQEPIEPVRFQVDEATFDDRLRELARLSEVIDTKESELKGLATTYESLSYTLAQYMLRTECKKKELSGWLFTQKQRVYSKVEDKEALRAWIAAHDAVDLLMTVHPSKLTGYVNECVETGNEVPAGVDPNFIKYSVSVKRT
jgi:vacuolar-type H+-ATPase subunit I/STV1